MRYLKDRLLVLAIMAALLFSLASCGRGGGDGPPPKESTSISATESGQRGSDDDDHSHDQDKERYSVSGTVQGLSGVVVLLNNGGDALTISANGAFTFATKLAEEDPYAVSVKTQPYGQTCLVQNNSGTINDENVTNVSLSCSANPGNSYAVSGTLSGLSGEVVLQNNGGDYLTVSANGIFTFATKLADGAAYAVSVKTSPVDQLCAATNNSGTIAGANVTNVSISCAAQKWVGTKQFGVPGQIVYAWRNAVDALGNVYVVGHTDGGLDGNVQTGIEDRFVTKYSPLGTSVWTKQFGMPGRSTGATGIAVDGSGNVYVAGGSGAQAAGTGTVIVTMYDSSGNMVRTDQFDAAGKDAGATSIAVDGAGNVYAAGCTTGGLDGNTQTGFEDLFVTMYDPAGNRVRTRQLGGQWTYGQAVAVDSAGNVYVAGETIGDLDGNTFTGIMDVFLTKYDALGNKVRTKQLGVSGKYALARGLAVDSTGNVYIVGYTDGGLDGNTLIGVWDLFIIKYDPSGNKIWTKQYGVAGTDSEAYEVAVDSADNIHVVGYTSGGLDGNTVTGGPDFFLMTFDKSGNKLRTRQLGVSGYATFAYGVAVNGANEVFVTGHTYSGLDGNSKIGNIDSFITKYDSSGTKQ